MKPTPIPSLRGPAGTPSSTFNSAIFLTLRSPLYPVTPVAPRCAPTTRASLRLGSGGVSDKADVASTYCSGPQTLGAGPGSVCPAHPRGERRLGPPPPAAPPKVGRRGGPGTGPRRFCPGAGWKAGRGERWGRGVEGGAAPGGAGKWRPFLSRRRAPRPRPRPSAPRPRARMA